MILELHDKENYTQFEMHEQAHPFWSLYGGIFNGNFETDNELLENYQILFEEEYMKVLKEIGFKPIEKILAINYTTSQGPNAQMLWKSIRSLSKALKVDAIAYAPGLIDIDQGQLCQKELESYLTPVAQTGILIMNPDARLPSAGLKLV
jgi:hypothetical protein